MPPNESHFRKLEQTYLAAPTNQYYKPRFYHAADAVHGSVYFKALDDAAFFAVNSIVEDVFVLTASFNLYLVRPVTDGEMKATGRLLATGSGTFMRSQIALDESIGYV
jgi:acyl-coenzyme A thioesterase PaaI-like protein